MTNTNIFMTHVVLCPDNFQTKRIKLIIPKNSTYKDFVVQVFNIEYEMFKDKSYIDTVICYNCKLRVLIHT